MRISTGLIIGVLSVGTSVPAGAQDIQIPWVYRADMTTPDHVFPHGIRGAGMLDDILKHSLGGSCKQVDARNASSWVSTSASLDTALAFAQTRLSGMEQQGTGNVVWVYQIRPDHTYWSVPHLMGQIINLGESSQLSYTPSHSATLRRQLVATALGSEQEVLTQVVTPEMIVEATPFWYVDGRLQSGPPYQNLRYIHSDTFVNTDLPANLGAYVPPASIHTDYREGSCAQSCDANAPTPIDQSLFAITNEEYCRIRSRWLSPAARRAVI